MKRLIFSLILCIGLALGVAHAADVPLTVGGWEAKSVRCFYASGSGTSISETLKPATMNTQLIELVSIEVHLDGVGTANSLTMTTDSALGSSFDTVWLTQDMTSVTDLVILYTPGEALFDTGTELDFAWTNGNQVDWGLTVKYRLR